MAKNEPKKNTNKPKAKGNAKGSKLIALMVLGVLGLCVLPVSVVALAGLLPSLVIFMTDKSRGRSVTVAIGALNITGVAYVVINMLRKDISLDYAVRILSDPANWLIMWGGAGFGYLLLSIIPPLVAQVLTTLSEIRSQKLKANQTEIRKIWGEDVKNP